MPPTIKIALRVALVLVIAAIFGLFVWNPLDGFLLDKNGQNIRYIETALDISLPGYTAIDFESSKGGFQGDGEIFARIAFSPENAPDGILESDEHWQPLPLPEELRSAALAEIFSGGIAQMEEPRYGWYYFRDRFAQNYPEQATLSFAERPAHNYIAALYDISEQILYYYQLDT